MTTTIVPILEQILHPPLRVTNRENITGLFSGSGDLTRPGGIGPLSVGVNAVGISWDFFTVPAGFGRKPGSPVIFDERMLQMSTVHQDITGHELTSEWHDFFSEGVYWLWENPFPNRVHYEVAPGVQVTFFWILAL